MATHLQHHQMVRQLMGHQQIRNKEEMVAQVCYQRQIMAQVVVEEAVVHHRSQMALGRTGLALQVVTEALARHQPFQEHQQPTQAAVAVRLMVEVLLEVVAQVVVGLLELGLQLPQIMVLLALQIQVEVEVAAILAHHRI
jgi:uncharacterized membrane protein